MDLTWSEGLKKRNKMGSSGSGFMSAPGSKPMSAAGASKPMSASAPSLPPLSRPNTVAGVPGECLNSAGKPLLAGGRQTSALQKGKDLRLAAFMDRQLNHPAIEARKAMSMLQRKIVTDGSAEDDIGFWGNKGVEGFRVYLKKRYGSVVAGWRVLDIDKNGRLSFYEFCNACRVMGYHGNLKKLWRQLDGSGNGFISLMEIDPEVGQAVGTFKLALMKKYGDMLTAWKQGLDTNGTGRIEEAEIEICLRSLGLEMSSKRLYGMLRGSPGGLGLTLMDFDPDAHKRSITGDLKGLLSKPNNEFVEDLPDIGNELSMSGMGSNMQGGSNLNTHSVQAGAARQYRQELAAADRKEVMDALAKVGKMKCGLHTLEGFKAAIINRCGSLLGGWKEHLDLDGNSRLTFGEFTQALHRLGFHGDVKGLWKQLDVKGMGYIMFGDLDKDTDDALTELREKLCKVHGNMLVAWLKGLDVKGTNLVDEKTFVAGCEQVGFTEASNGITAKSLFRLMRPEQGRKFITLKDFDTKAYCALSRGDFRMISESSESDKFGKKKPMEMTFDERQESGFVCQIRRAWDAAKREEFAKACSLANEPDHLINSSEGFETLIIRKYGSIINAWRNCLDADHNGKLTFNEFCQVTRWLGYSGDLKLLWKKYDVQKKGFILLADLDPEADNHVSSLMALLNERYGDLNMAWKNGFNKDPHDSIDEAELHEACNTLGYPHDPHRLFKCLQPMPGRQLITIWDLDPAESRRRAQGKGNDLAAPAHPAMNAMVPRSPTSKPNLHQPAFGEFTEFDENGQAVDNGLGGPHNISSSTVSYRPTNNADMPSLLKNMRVALKRKHGSTTAAWRSHFDPELSGAVSFGKFCIVVNDCSFYGNVKAIWSDLAGEKGMISFRDLDPEAARQLDEAREFFVGSSGNILKGFRTVLDQEGCERVDEENFLNKMMGSVKSPKKLFRLLLSRLGQRSIIVEDMEALLITVPPADRKKVWDGAGVAIGPDDNQDTLSELLQRPNTAGSSRGGALRSPKGHGATPGTEESPRRFVNQAVSDHHGQDRIVTDLPNLKKMLIIKYGSLFSAWRKGLDVDQNGVVTQKDFAVACQRLGVKAVQKIWSEFDKNKDGQISLNEIDPECAELFNSLEQLLIEKYGTIKNGWNCVFDKEKSLRCDRDKFVSECKAIGFTGDADKLFKRLRPEPGRPFVNFDDLWINININDFALKHAEPNTTQGSPRSARASTPQPPNRPQSPLLGN